MVPPLARKSKSNSEVAYQQFDGFSREFCCQDVDFGSGGILHASLSGPRWRPQRQLRRHQQHQCRDGNHDSRRSSASNHHRRPVQSESSQRGWMYTSFCWKQLTFYPIVAPLFEARAYTLRFLNMQNV